LHAATCPKPYTLYPKPYASSLAQAGAIRGCAPFKDGIDLFGFYNDIDETEAQRYADGTS